MKDKNIQKNAREEMMLSEPIEKLIPKMAIPTILAFLINSVYSLADTYFVSSLGTEATAAVSVNSSLDQLIMMMGSMLAVGGNSYIARLLGQGDKEKANRVLATSFFSAMSLGILLMIIGSTFITPLVRILGSTPTCEKYSIDYARYVLLAAPFMASNFVMNQCLRSEGSAIFSMFGMGFGGILNCILDPIFIFRFDMGVAGASLATAISKLISFLILIYPYATKHSVLNLSIRNFKPNYDIVKNIVSIGSSSMFRSGLAVVSAILLNELAGNISDSVLAGIGVCTKIMMFPFSAILGFGTGFQPVAGYNWGAKRFDRVNESFAFSAKVSAIGSVIVAALLAVFAKPIIVIFAGKDPEMLRIGIICLVSQCIAMPIHSWVAMVNMFCAGLGNARGALILSTSRQGTCFLPILFVLSWMFGAYGIAVCQAIADVLTLVLAIPILFSVKKKIRLASQK